MEDHEIVQLFWVRDEQAIPQTGAKYGAYCASIAQNILGSAADAEECVNDTLLAAWQAMPPHRPARLSVFLGKLTRNLALNRYRHATAEKRGGGQFSVALDELAECTPARVNVEDEHARRELARTIDGFLSTLSPERRGIFLCRYWYLDSIPAIAARFQRTENHIYVTLSRLRAKLRAYLSERGFTV